MYAVCPIYISLTYYEVCVSHTVTNKKAMLQEKQIRFRILHF